MSQLLRRLVVLQPGEAPVLLASFATLLCTFSSYAILRPVRDALGVTSGLETIPALFWGVFVAMLLLQPLYGWLTSRLPRSVFLPWVYIFFAANLVGFWFWFHLQTDHTWIARCYFVWVSVFNLFILAAFWGLMADVFTREQAGRLFGFIWAGASSGGVIGPYIDKTLAVPFGTVNLLLLSAGLLLIALIFMRLIIRWHHHHQVAQLPRAPAATSDSGAVAHGMRGVGGGVLAAFSQVARSPYLLGIAAFVVLMTWVNTFFYLEQQAFVAKAFTTANQRTHFFASIDLYVQIASLAMQFLLFSRLYRWFGMRALLACVPLMMTAGYALYALVPAFMLLVVVYAVRRVADYAITRPCRDSLFTVVSREEKYQAKSLIDTFAYRGGDATSGSLHKLLVDGLGASHSTVGWIGALISAVWTALALALGRAQERARDHTATETPAAAGTRARA
ncbi:MAG TPA: MFS transporter [Steroidobacteraceae bacterium]|jgi:AAA family ATP:ADP antiporter|nr:MFS transporter [Steroidobacteraceae bacterium]